jgi:competence protein ComFB
MEDVVTDVLDILLKERGENGNLSKQCKLDIIAFSLNRLPPKYIVSERGFTHSFIEEVNNTNWKADIISVVNLGIDIISKRKRNYIDSKTISNNKTNLIEDLLHLKEDNTSYYNFPHLIGQVFDKETFKPLNNVKVSLYLDDVLAESSDSSWINPYITNEATQGFYSFWPKSIKAIENNPETRKFNFRIHFSRKNYFSHNKEFYMSVEPEKINYKFIRRNFTEKIDLTTLEKRKR